MRKSNGSKMARVNISDVAREAGVSLGTVSNAINHPERVRPETRRLIEEAIERLGYLPNQSARLLAGGSNAVIGLVLPRLNHGCSVQIASGARNEAERAGLDLVIMNSNENTEVERRYLRFCTGMQLAGVLVQPSTYQVSPPQHAPSVPVVYLGALGAPREVLSVSADYRAQGRLIAEHVVACGARRVAVIGSASLPPLAERLAGIQSVGAEHPECSFEVLDEGRRYGSTDGARLGEKLAKRASRERPDAIIGLADAIAAGAIQGVQAAGCDVPGDIMVAGCDGNPLAWGGAVPLTTCSPAGYEIGRKGVQMLVGQIAAMEEKNGRSGAVGAQGSVIGTRNGGGSVRGAAEAHGTGGVRGVSGALGMGGTRGTEGTWGTQGSSSTPSAGAIRNGTSRVAVRPSAVLRGEVTRELVRPFLLERASTVGQGAAHRSELSGLGAVRTFAELDMGSYL